MLIEAKDKHQISYFTSYLGGGLLLAAFLIYISAFIFNYFAFFFL
jgi:hypothetical protein